MRPIQAIVSLFAILVFASPPTYGANEPSAEAKIWLDRSVTAREAGNLEDALAYANKAIAVAPQLAVAYGNRAATYRRMIRFKDALADDERALELDPNEAGAWDDLAAT